MNLYIIINRSVRIYQKTLRNTFSFFFSPSILPHETPQIPYNEGKEGILENPENSTSSKHSYQDVALLVTGLLAIAVDPLFFYLPVMKNFSTCIELDKTLTIVAVILRTCIDILNNFQWWWPKIPAPIKRLLHSRNEGANKEPHTSAERRKKTLSKNNTISSTAARSKADNKVSSHGGRSSAKGNVTNVSTILKIILSPEGRLSREALVLAILASFPLPQVVVFTVDLQYHLKTCLKIVVICQFIPRILRIYPSYVATTRDASLFALIGTSFNVFLFALAGHILGSFWYLRPVERRMTCLERACRGLLGCDEYFRYCENGYYYANIGNLSDICAVQPTSNGTVPFEYGMYSDAITLDLIGSTNFIKKVSGSFWWGINSLSSNGLNIIISNYIWDTFFAVFICLFGLTLSALLYGNAQILLQSRSPPTMAKLKDKIERLHKWPLFGCLPKQMRKEVIMCQHPKWQEVSEVNLESLLNNIPWQLRRKLKRCLCKKLFHEVGKFSELDKKIKEELRERATAVVFQAGTKIYKEGYPMYKMIHIVQGKVLKFNSKDAMEGRTAKELKEDDSFGQELLSIALESPSPEHPLAKETIQSMTQVEAFALSLDDFVKVFTKNGRFIRPYKEEWATYAITSAFRKLVAIKKWKEYHRK